MTTENEQRRQDRQKEKKIRDEAGVPNNADLNRKGPRHGSGADTPSGPDTDRRGERARNQTRESIEQSTKNPSSLDLA